MNWVGVDIRKRSQYQPPDPCYPVAYPDCDEGGGDLATRAVDGPNSVTRDGDLSMMANMESDSATTNGPAPIAVYLYAGDQIIENVTTGNLYFQDSLGNTSHVTDAAGNLVESYTYSAFGQPSFFNSTSQPLNSSTYNIKHLFQGQLWTQETGLNDYRNRVELPTMGVFLQPDPVGFKGDAGNLYRFCNNDDVNRTDPMGLIDRNWDAVRQAMDNCNLIGFFQAEADANAQAASTTSVPNTRDRAESQNPTTTSMSADNSHEVQSTSHATSTNPIEVDRGWERTSEGPWRAIGSHYGQITGKGGTGRMLGRIFKLVGLPFRPIPTIRWVREIYNDYERTITERAYIEYCAFTVRTTERIDSAGEKWTLVRSGNEQWKDYTGETRTREEFRSDYMGTTP